MSRYTITVTNDDHADPDATIGYDPPLRTFFLQAFPDVTGDDLALWLGTSDREYETVDALHMAALSRGYSFMPLPEDIASQLIAGPRGRGQPSAALRPARRVAATSAIQVAATKARAGRCSGAGLFCAGLAVTTERHSILDRSQ